MPTFLGSSSHATALSRLSVARSLVVPTVFLTRWVPTFTASAASSPSASSPLFTSVASRVRCPDAFHAAKPPTSWLTRRPPTSVAARASALDVRPPASSTTSRAPWPALRPAILRACSSRSMASACLSCARVAPGSRSGGTCTYRARALKNRSGTPCARHGRRGGVMSAEQRDCARRSRSAHAAP